MTHRAGRLQVTRVGAMVPGVPYEIQTKRSVLKLLLAVLTVLFIVVPFDVSAGAKDSSVRSPELLGAKHAAKSKRKAPKSKRKAAKSKRKAPKSTRKAAKSKRKAAKSKRRGCQIHEVKRGDSLIKIARKYKVKLDDLIAHNDLDKRKPLRLGQQLEIPIKSRWCKPRRSSAASSSSSTKGRKKGPWRPAKPPAWTQTQRTSAERGVNPCNTPDKGFGVYDRWSREPSIGQMIAPQSGGITRSGAFDVMFHFHGHEAVRKEWVRVMNGAVLVGIDLGLGSGPYQRAFRNPAVFKHLVRSVEQAMARKTGKKNAHARKIGLSAWSAGYGAVESILRSPQTRRMIDSVILLDGMHAGYEPDGSLERRQLEPFLWFARQAVRRRKFMFVSHSSIIPPGYASTTETSQWLIHELGGKPRRRHPRGGDPMGLELICRYDRGNFHVRGYKGNDKMDHCAHIGLYRDILKVHIKRRWRSPRGRKRKKKR